MEGLKFKIGELSKLCHITVRTLYHYEEIGLLIPCFIHPDTGHRYYNSEQLMKLCYIKWYKEQGFTLSEIKDRFEKGNPQTDITKLENLLQECTQELNRLKKRQHCLESLIREQKKREEKEDIYLDKLPSIIVASHTIKLSHYDELEKRVREVTIPEMLRLDCIIPHPFYCFSQETGRTFDDGTFEVEFCDEVLQLGEDSDIIRFKQLPKVPLAFCMKMYGPLKQLESYRMKLFAEIARCGYQVVGIPRYNYVDGVWNQKDPKKWLTIIQVPVEKINPNDGKEKK